MKKLLKGLAGIAVSAIFIWLTLRNKDVKQMWEAMKSADYLYLGYYFLALTGVHLCRTIRWGILLEPLDPDIGFKRLNAVSAAGFMLLIAMPFRLGEFARPALIADRKKITFTNSLSSIVVERVVDGLAMTVLLLGTLPFVHTSSPDLDRVRYFGWVFFSIFGGGGVFLVFAYFKHDLALKLVHFFGDPVSPKLTQKLLGIMESFVQGLRAVPSAGRVVWFFALTLIYWGLNGYGLRLLAQGFGLELTPLAGYTVFAVLTVGVMIPAGPGMVGIFQYFTELGLKLFLPLAIVDRAGSAYSNVVWAAQFGQQVLFGLIFMAIGHVDIGNAFRFSNEEDNPDKDDKGEPKAIAQVSPP